MRPLVQVILTALALTSLGCAHTEVTTSGALSPASTPPRRIVVFDFAATTDDIKLDRGLLPKLEQAVDSRPETDQEVALGRKLGRTMADEVVDELKEAGFDARRAGRTAPNGSLIITGELLHIDEGNQTRRVVIGLGAGRSRVHAAAQVYQLQHGRPVLLEQFVGDARSGIKPGLAESMGAGIAAAAVARAAVTGATLATGSEAFLASAQADVKRMAKELARQIEGMYVVRGWAR